jgi:hypothetical protein
LRLEIVFGDLKLRLQRARVDIVQRHFGDQTHQHIPVIRNTRFKIPLGRFDRAAYPAKDVDLPACIKARPVELALVARTEILTATANRSRPAQIQCW